MSSTAPHPEPITRAGYERLRAELAHLTTVRRRELAEELRQAREDGTEPGDNASLSAVLEERSAVERRIEELDSTLAFVRVVEPAPPGVAGIGQRVRISIDGGPAVSYHLVGALEADPAERRISIDSPVGQALDGCRAGDVVEVQTPRGSSRVEILAIGTDA